MKILTKLPAGVMPVTPASLEWRWPIARGLAMVRQVVHRVAESDNDEPGEVTESVELVDRELISEHFFEVYQGLDITPGLTVLTGGTGTGKTQLALNLAGALADAYSVGWVTLNEPAQFSDSLNSDHDVEEILLEWDALPQILFIDSFRLLQFSANGAARAGGVSSGIFEMLTEINNAATRANVMVVGLFNPLVADAAVAERYASEIASSIYQLITLSTYNSGTVTSRKADRKGRPFTIDTSASLTPPTQSSPLEVIANPVEAPDLTRYRNIF